MSYQETVRWIFNNVKALLGRFEYIDRPKGSVEVGRSFGILNLS